MVDFAISKYRTVAHRHTSGIIFRQVGNIDNFLSYFVICCRVNHRIGLQLSEVDMFFRENLRNNVGYLQIPLCCHPERREGSEGGGCIVTNTLCI